MTIFDSIILGVVEGFTEFLPISSTGHLIITSALLQIPQTEFLKSFEIAIQLGAILSVVTLYFRQLLQIELIKKLVVGFIPTGIIGLLTYGLVKTYLLTSGTIVIAALFLGGIALIVFELLHTESEKAVGNISDISYKQAAMVGLFQSIAIVPGVSRSAASILGGLLMGIRRTTIVEFSFLLAVPTMLAATGLDLIKTSASFSAQELLLLSVGFAVSFVVALFSIKFLLAFVRQHTFIPFGIYRIAVSLLLVIVLVLHM